MKFCQLIDITWEILFFKNHAKNKSGRLVPDLFPFFKKYLFYKYINFLYEEKQMVNTLIQYILAVIELDI